jgi:hypothetical protein
MWADARSEEITGGDSFLRKRLRQHARNCDSGGSDYWCVSVPRFEVRPSMAPLGQQGRRRYARPSSASNAQ